MRMFNILDNLSGYDGLSYIADLQIAQHSMDAMTDAEVTMQLRALEQQAKAAGFQQDSILWGDIATAWEQKWKSLR